MKKEVLRSSSDMVFLQKKKVFDYLNDPENKRNSPPKRKSILSSLVILTKDDEYRKQMNKDISKYQL